MLVIFLIGLVLWMMCACVRVRSGHLDNSQPSRSAGKRKAYIVYKRGLVGNTRLLSHAKMLLVPMFSFSLTGRLCSAGKRFD